MTFRMSYYGVALNKRIFDLFRRKKDVIKKTQIKQK